MGGRGRRSSSWEGRGTMLWLRIALLVVVIAVLIQVVARRTARATTQWPQTAEPVCTGEFKGGVKPSPTELADILQKHSEWLKDGARDLYNPIFFPNSPIERRLRNDPRRANLCGANLTSASLHSAMLRGANLKGADLDGMDLAGAHFEAANLREVSLVRANLRGAIFVDTDLSGVNLSGADLSGGVLLSANLTRSQVSGANLTNADLIDAALSNADLEQARLTGAQMTTADLTDANLEDAVLLNAKLNLSNLSGAYLDLDLDSVPKATDIYDARNLSLVRFHDDPGTLVKLRREFRDLGLRTQEAELTCAIRRSELSRTVARNGSKGRYLHSWPERYFNLVFFDWTCQYGMSPGRPLGIMVLVTAICSIFYLFAQVDAGPDAGIWAVWDEKRIKQNEGSKEPQQLTYGFPDNRWEMGFLWLAIYFSLLSALRIGWSGLNFGTWLTRIQRREYTLQATGWVRVVSGVQSLISVYLIALAILSYFGTPFEY
jgi:Pentapeptide repeats (8 copies)